MSTPFLSIVMPVYNAEKFIHKAITSLLDQTFRDFELIVVDDGSTDKSLDVVTSFNDARIRILTNEQNRGIVFSRNRGNAAAKGRYIAPFDADDIARKDKFEKQIIFLEKQPEFGMIGSWALLMDEQDNLLKKKWKVDAPPESIPAIQLFRNYFIQSAVVMRREAIPPGNYTEGFDAVEDYKMWFEISRKYKVWNYPDYLLKYRLHAESITQRQISEMNARDVKVYDFIFNALGMNLNEQQKALLLIIKGNEKINDTRQLGQIQHLLMHILRQNNISCVFERRELIKVLYNRWLKSCYKAGLYRCRVLHRFVFSPLQVERFKSFIR